MDYFWVLWFRVVFVGGYVGILEFRYLWIRYWRLNFVKGYG